MTLKLSRALPWVIFGLVLVIAWMTLGRASSYYVDAVVAPPTTPGAMPPPGTVTTPTMPPPPGVMTPPPPGTVPATVPTVASAPVPTGPASKYNMKPGFDFPRNTLSMYPTNNPDSCAALCDASSKCAGYVLDTQSPMCMLKSYFGTSATSTLRNSYSKPGISLA